ncbi:hypothetical protein, partial [Methanocalculus sp.]|uniref:hypothetical protein n=1 Tax=Methanocalculus sp. TaxID=2004547 RepID=UPI002621332E
MGSAEKFVHQFEQCYPVLRAREKFIWKNDQDLAHHIEFAKKRYFDCQNKKSRTQMKNEISLCKKFWKCNTY